MPQEGPIVAIQVKLVPLKVMVIEVPLRHVYF